MKIWLTASFAALLCLSSPLQAEWLPGSQAIPQGFSEQLHKNVIVTGDYECRIDLIIPGLELTTAGTDAGIQFHDDFNSSLNAHISGYVNLPPTSTPHITVNKISYNEYDLDPSAMLNNPSEITWDDAEYSKSAVIHIGKPGIFRDLRIAPISIKPYRIYPETGKILVTSEISITITFTEGSTVNPKLNQRPLSPAFTDIYRSLVWNFTDDPADEITPLNYLIICPDDFVNAVIPLSDWKNQKGVKTTVVPFSQINANSQDEEIIRNYIESVYFYGENPPDYVLLVGDETQFPIHLVYTQDPPTPFSYASYPGFYTNDNYFACLEGDDYFPEVNIGRICAGNTTTVTLIVNKIIFYEKTPYTQSTDWYDRGIVCADQTEPTQRTTKMYVRDIMLDDGGFSQVDSLYLGGQSSMLMGWINSGRSIINYRGSGWSNGWAGVNLYVGDLNSLQNYGKLMIVTGIGCGVSKFDDYGTCFGEAWMAAGTINNPKGAVAFIGPTWNTHTQYNNYLDRGIYEALWQDSLRTLGDAHLAGKMNVHNHYAPYIAVNEAVEEIVRVMFGQYIIMSDPELSVRASVPQTISVTHPPTVTLGQSSIQVMVNDNVGTPLENLQVCAYIPDETFTVDLTSATGQVELSINPQSLPSNLYLTVTGIDIDTYTNTILVSSDGQFVSHIGCDFIEDPPGDTLIAPGETILLSDHAKNYGNLAANSVWSEISSSIEGVIFENDSAYYGDFLPSVDLWAQNDFRLTLPEDYTGNYLPLNIAYHDDESNTWTSDFSLDVHRPNLIFQGFDVNPGPDGLLERGGEAEIQITLQNMGDLPAYDMTAVLTSIDPEVIVLDSESELGNIVQGQQLNNSNDPFVFRVGDSCPNFFLAHFTVEISGDQGGFNYSTSVDFELLVGDPSAVDPAQDEQGLYYAFEERDYLYAQAPVYNWVEISPAEGGPGTLIDFDSENQVMILDLPFPWVYYGESFDRLTVSADGFLVPDSLDVTSNHSWNLPYIDYFAGVVAPLWYDMLCPVFEPGDVSSYYNEAEGSFIIEYHNWSHDNSNFQHEFFQIVIYDQIYRPTITGDSDIEFIYGDLTQIALVNSMCGIESPDQQDGILMWNEYEYPSTSFEPMDNTIIRFTTISPEIVSIDDDIPAGNLLPASIYLTQNYPNPFNPSTTIEFGLPSDSQIELDVYNLLGEKVATLADGKLTAGTYNLTWNAGPHSSGIYFFRLSSPDDVRIVKGLLIK